MKIPTWEFLVAALAAYLALWGRVVEAWRLVRRAVIAHRTTEYMLGQLILRYLATVGRVYGSSTSYGADMDYVKSLGRVHRVCYQALASARQMFWFRGRAVWYEPISAAGGEVNTAVTAAAMMRFEFVRGTVDWEKLLIEAAEWEATTHRHNRRHAVYHQVGSNPNDPSRGRGRSSSSDDKTDSDWGPGRGVRVLKWELEDLGHVRKNEEKAMDGLSLRPELVAVSAEIGEWFRTEEWYVSRGIPWRRGYAFYGVPGGGKTSFVRAVAEDLDLPVYVFDLATLSNQDLRAAWETASANTPAVILLEDIDAVFRGRENISGGKLTFDCLLNTLDGIERVSGVLLVVTTNNFDSLDPALVNRAGRIDRVVEFLPLDHAGRRKMALRVLKDPELAERLAVEYQSDTATAFQERLVRIALDSREKPGISPYR